MEWQRTRGKETSQPPTTVTQGRLNSDARLGNEKIGPIQEEMTELTFTGLKVVNQEEAAEENDQVAGAFNVTGLDIQPLHFLP